ncbi:MAG: DUF2752 domain-containing protein [Chloroflexi bacterium]|nr:DUF2752 domain-containing protein [Chloroflexota bacterium]
MLFATPVIGRAARLLPYVRPATVAALALLVGLVVPPEAMTAGPSFCPFKVMTGLPCPGCGLTRSVVFLLHGDLTASLYFHPLGIVTVAAFLFLLVADGWRWYRDRRQVDLSSTALLDWLVTTPAPWVAVAALALVWVVRLPLFVAGFWVF